ncbi:MAG: hypothetical protein ACRDXX_15330 [Stackebrandtia sp.]
MTEDLKNLLDEASGDDRPAFADPDDLVTRGRRRVRRKNAGVIGSAALGVAAVTAGVVMLPAVFAGPTDDGARPDDRNQAADADEQPEYPLPELDPDGDYNWIVASGDPKTNEDTEVLTEALWSYFDDYLEDLDPELFGEDDRVEVVDPDTDEPIDRDDYPSLSRYNKLLDGEDYQAPVYGFSSEDDMIDESGGVRLRFPEGHVGTDQILKVEFHSKGSYAEGEVYRDEDSFLDPAVPYLTPGCGDKGETADDGSTTTLRYTFECAGGEGDNLARGVNLTVTPKDDDSEAYESNTLVVYGADGNALVLTMFPVGFPADENPAEWTIDEGQSAGLGLGELNMLALALAQDVIIE